MMFVARGSKEQYRGTSLMKNSPLPWDPTVGLYLGPYGCPRVVSVSYERGTPVVTSGLESSSAPPPPRSALISQAVFIKLLCKS